MSWIVVASAPFNFAPSGWEPLREPQIRQLVSKPFDERWQAERELCEWTVLVQSPDWKFEVKETP